MQTNLQRFDISQIKLFCNFSLLVFLILQISLAEVSLNHFSDQKKLESATQESSVLSVCCIEDIEDKNVKPQVISFNVASDDTSDVVLTNVNPLNYYVHSLNHSRSPPV